MSNKYEKIVITQCLQEQPTVGGSVKDIIKGLQRLENSYPGCYIKWFYGEESLYWDRLEADEEYEERMAQLKAKEHTALEKKKAQYEKLKKELGLDDQA